MTQATLEVIEMFDPKEMKWVIADFPHPDDGPDGGKKMLEMFRKNLPVRQWRLAVYGRIYPAD